MTPASGLRAPEPIEITSAPSSPRPFERPWAIVAFVPEDLAWCDWLYRELHGYRVPSALVDCPTHHGLPLPERLSIYPDPSAPSPFDRFSEELTRIGHLIVVCSPNSSRAPTIDDQIRAFKTAGGEERIIALVVEDEPDACIAVRSPTHNAAWLPPWLRWRLEENGFAPADRAEPRIIDVRPGFHTLDQVRTALRAAVLDISSNQLDELGETASEPPRNVVTFAQQPLAVLPPAEHIAKTGPAKRPLWSGQTAWVAAIFLVLGAAGVWLSGSPAKRLETRAATENQPLSGRAVNNPADPDQPALGTSPTLPPPLGLSSSPPTSAAMEPASPGPLNQPAAATLDVIFLAQDASSQAANAAAELEIQRQTALLRSSLELEQRGDWLLENGLIPEALQAYERALAAVASLSNNSEPTTQMGLATLCWKLGTLQASLASSAEARRTFERGRKALLPLKTDKELSKERAKLLTELETSLRKLLRDDPLPDSQIEQRRSGAPAKGVRDVRRQGRGND